MKRPYRPCVTGVFVNSAGRILACRRSDHPDGLQLPQGGVEKGETDEEALLREMCEELGTDAFVIVKKANTTVSYDFPAELDVPMARRFCGQRQRWFQLRFNAQAAPDLQRADAEFSSCCWTTCATLLQQTVAWKVTAYRKGLQLLGLLER